MVPGEKYHLLNHTNGRENIFLEQRNYNFFLKKPAHPILPVCKLFIYCMMPNHFDLVLQVQQVAALRNHWRNSPQLPELLLKQPELKISKSFSNLFSSRTRANNKVYYRMGSMFFKGIKMTTIGGKDDLWRVIHYSPANPVHHGFTMKIEDWPTSSYKIFLSSSPTK